MRLRRWRRLYDLKCRARDVQSHRDPGCGHKLVGRGVHACTAFPCYAALQSTGDQHATVWLARDTSLNAVATWQNLVRMCATQNEAQTSPLRLRSICNLGDLQTRMYWSRDKVVITKQQAPVTKHMEWFLVWFRRGHVVVVRCAGCVAPRGEQQQLEKRTSVSC
jgi:hypothetical protein